MTKDEMRGSRMMLAQSAVKAMLACVDVDLCSDSGP